MAKNNNLTDFLTDIAEAIRSVGNSVSYTPDSEGYIRNLSVNAGEVLTFTLDSSLSSFEYLEEIHLEITIDGDTSYPDVDFDVSLTQTYTVPSGVTSMTVRVFDDGGTLDTVPYTLTINRTTDELINPQDFSTRIRNMSGGSSGGGSTAENCTVTLSLQEFDMRDFRFLYVVYENGVATQKQTDIEASDGYEGSIQVAKNTPLTILYLGDMNGDIEGEWESLVDVGFGRYNGSEFPYGISGLYSSNTTRVYHIFITKDTEIILNPDY